jgi:hypothetical protein
MRSLGGTGRTAPFPGWLAAADHDRLDASLQRFVGSAGYDVAESRRDLDRFTFLLGGDDGDALFPPRRQQ